MDRAWCLHEEAFGSSDSLFSDAEIFWGCRVKGANGSFHEGTPRLSEWYMLHLEKRPLFHSWKTIVALYTSEKLPFGKDKLVTISGIARAVQKETNDDEFT